MPGGASVTLNQPTPPSRPEFAQPLRSHETSRCCSDRSQRDKTFGTAENNCRADQSDSGLGFTSVEVLEIDKFDVSASCILVAPGAQPPFCSGEVADRALNIPSWGNHIKARFGTKRTIFRSVTSSCRSPLPKTRAAQWPRSRGQPLLPVRRGRPEKRRGVSHPAHIGRRGGCS